MKLIPWLLIILLYFPSGLAAVLRVEKSVLRLGETITYRIEGLENKNCTIIYWAIDSSNSTIMPRVFSSSLQRQFKPTRVGVLWLKADAVCSEGRFNMEKKIDVLPTNSSKESPAQIYVSSSHKARGLGCIIPLVLSTLLCCLLLWRR